MNLGNPDKRGHIIFIGGIHGVGKTTVANRLSEIHQLPFKSCSSVIKEEAGCNNIINTKDALDSNQQFLLRGLARLRKSHRIIILDGHYSLRTETEGLQPIPLDVFLGISPSLLAIMERQSDTIVERLLKRDQAKVNIDAINQHAKFERDCAENICRNLNVPLINIQDENHAKIDEFILRLKKTIAKPIS